MSEETKIGAPQDPSRRALMKAGVAGAAALGSIAAGTAAGPAAAQPVVGRKHRMLASSLIHTGQVQPFTGQTWGAFPFEYRMRQVAEAGFTGVGLFHTDVDHVLRFEAKGSSRKKRIRWMKDVLDDNGLVDIEIEFLVEWMFPKGDGRREAEEPVRQLLIEMAQIMKPHHLKCGNFAQPVSVEQCNFGFRELCADFPDTIVAMEVLTNDPHGGSIEDLKAIVDGPDNGGLFFDTWHTNNIPGLTYEDIANLSPGKIVGIELDDGWLIEEKYRPYFEPISAPGFIEKTVNCRCCLGEGNFDVVGFIQAVAATGYDGPWGNEILSENVRRYPIEMMLPHIYKTSLAHIRAALDGTEIPRLIRADYE